MRLFVIFIFIFTFILQACAPVYVPSTRHTHMLDKKGELSGAVLAGTNGFDVQGAYAVSDHIGIAAVGSYGKSDNKDDIEDDHEHSYGELALEYYLPFGRIGRFELLGGAGRGTATAYDRYYLDGIEREFRAVGKYNKLFVQTNVGLETNWIETGLALRLGHVNFTQFEARSTVFDGSEPGTFFEPAVFARLGWKNIMVEGQAGTSVLLQDEENFTFAYVPILISLGIRLNLSLLP